MNISIVIPAYNEEKKIIDVIKDIKDNADQIIKNINQPNTILDIIVINDGSRDKTQQIAQSSGVDVYSHIINLGLGATLVTGFDAAVLKKSDIIVTMDADGQHKAEYIFELIKPIVFKKADVVIGSRLINNNAMPFIRRVYNRLGNLITYLLFKQKTTDSQSGFRAFSYKALKSMEIKSQRMEISSEIFKEIKNKNLQLIEVPIPAIYTDYSLSKGQGFITGIKTLFRLILNRFV